MQWAGSRGQSIRGGAALPRKPLAILWEQAVSSPCCLCPNSHLQFFLFLFFFLTCFISEYLREGNGNPLQYSCLENPMDGGAWWAEVHGVTKSGTGLRDFTFSFHFPALEKEMATHSSVLAWRIPGTGKPGRWPSMGSHRVWHDWSDLAAAAYRNTADY